MVEFVGEIREWAGLIFSAIVVPLYWMFRSSTERVLGKLEGIDAKVNVTNGKVIKLETWVGDHEKEDQRNYERAARFQDEIREGMKDLRSRQ